MVLKQIVETKIPGMKRYILTNGQIAITLDRLKWMPNHVSITKYEVSSRECADDDQCSYLDGQPCQFQAVYREDVQEVVKRVQEKQDENIWWEWLKEILNEFHR